MPTIDLWKRRLRTATRRQQLRRKSGGKGSGSELILEGERKGRNGAASFIQFLPLQAQEAHNAEKATNLQLFATLKSKEDWYEVLSPCIQSWCGAQMVRVAAGKPIESTRFTICLKYTCYMNRQSLLTTVVSCHTFLWKFRLKTIVALKIVTLRIVLILTACYIYDSDYPR